MQLDDELERGIQALLDGRPLQLRDDSEQSASANPLRVVDALARAHRTAIFGSDVRLDRQAFTMWGHLEVRGEIGRGASGTVYRAWDTRLEREVALKLFTSEAGPGDAIEEGRLLARLNHPHIVRVFGADTYDEVTGIWMELLEGDTLDQVLARDGLFTAEETLIVGLDLSRALAAVHSAGLLHRDVKARNVLRERGGRIVLMDLGAGRVARDTPRGGDETGTPMYMAPEVLAGQAATVRSDIYCLAVLLYRLLTGTYPVTAADLEGLHAAHAEGRRAPLSAVRPGLPAALMVSIERGCHPNPDARYHSAAEFELALTEALHTSLSERAEVVPSITRAWTRWRRVLQVTGATIVIASLVVWGLWNSNPGRYARRAMGLVVPPRSTLYMTINGGLAILKGNAVTLVAHNPATATVMAVSSDQGIVTMSAIPPWIPGGVFRLDGTPVGSPRRDSFDLCCFNDGTTDGQFNYAPRTDSTLLEPRGSRRLDPPALYRFNRDWSHPVRLFELVDDGLYYGVAFSPRSNSFWLTKSTSDGSVIEHWSRDGTMLSMPVMVPDAVLTNMAVDPADGTLWSVRQRYAGEGMRLENFDASGKRIASVNVTLPAVRPFPDSGGAEFAWAPPK